MLTPDDFGLSDRHYRVHGQQLSEAMPDRCPAGHVLGENTVSSAIIRASSAPAPVTARGDAASAMPAGSGPLASTDQNGLSGPELMKQLDFSVPEIC